MAIGADAEQTSRSATREQASFTDAVDADASLSRQDTLANSSVVDVEGTTGGIDEFQMFNALRLQMVERFGSVASALYEFGADPETGRLSRASFIEVCASSLSLYSAPDAARLFMTITGADPSDTASLRHFNISEDEWRFIVKRKQQAALGKSPAPFQSTPSGASAGIFHRSVTINQMFDRESNENGSMFPSKPHSPHKARMRPRRSASGRRIWPWQLPQQPWTPSVYYTTVSSRNERAEPAFSSVEKAGTQGDSAKAERPKQTARDEKASRYMIWTSPEVTLTHQPRHSLLAPPSRGRCKFDEQHAVLVAKCPTRRSEMEPALHVSQAQEWWPHLSPRPPRKMRIPRLRLTG
eukprot:TRINITY_DN15582_c0_g1_i1.p1 TRINITY_DN15582_c0_g1~~TRINITY_DN15582_c0_g1_i1.p1  ORF type:complete len:368 (+),score=45.54 TRINITY_DN15582_c0_g1_i1:48-1106(+)